MSTPGNAVAILGSHLVLALATCVIGCQSVRPAISKENQPQPDQVVRVPLAAHGVKLADYGVNLLTFSRDSRYVCAWRGNQYRKEPGEAAVFDLAGRAVPDAVDAQKRLQGPFVDLFPAVSFREQCAEFIKDAQGWGFTDGFTMGLRLVDPTPPIRPGHPDEIGNRRWHAELWRLKPQEERLWRMELPPSFFSLRETGFFEADGKGLVFLAFTGEKGYLLSAADGALVAALYYDGHTKADLGAPAPSQGPHGQDVAPDGVAGLPLRYAASAFLIDPARRLVAQAWSDSRVHVISLDPPYDMVFAAPAGENPYKDLPYPWHAEWFPWKVQFAGEKYLIAEWYLGGRGCMVQELWTRIYDVDTWKVVWLCKTPTVQSLTMSPDGKKLAYLFHDNLEIVPFIASP